MTRSTWGAAMRAELAAIDDPDDRREFARSAARAAFARGLGIHIAVVLGTAVVVGTVTVCVSRLQLPSGGPGLLGPTVPILALVLFVAAVISGRVSSSVRTGIVTGLLAALTGFIVLNSVLTIEGDAWMDRHGVFILDGDPPRGPVDTTDILLNVFTTGMWMAYTMVWIPALLVGAIIGSVTRRGNRRVARGSARRA